MHSFDYLNCFQLGNRDNGCQWGKLYPVFRNPVDKIRYKSEGFEWLSGPPADDPGGRQCHLEAQRQFYQANRMVRVNYSSK